MIDELSFLGRRIMNIKEFIKKTPSIIVVAIMLLAMAYVILFAKGNYTVSSQGLEKSASEIINQDIPARGIFIPTKNYIKSISCIFNRDTDDEAGEVTFSLFNEAGELLAANSAIMNDISFGYMHEFDLNVKLVPGQAYRYEIAANGYGEHPVSVDLITPSAGTGEILTFGFGTEDVFNAILLTQTTYKTKLSYKQILPYIMVICVIAILLILAIEDKRNISSFAKISIYAFFVLGISMLILMNDEGSKPISIKGTELKHENGYDDYRGYLQINEESGFYGLLASSDDYILNKGEYSINLSYLTSSMGSTIEVYNDGVMEAQADITFGSTYEEIPFTLTKDSQNVQIRIYYDGAGLLKINNVELKPKTYFYYDNFFMLGLFLVLNLLGILLYRRHLNKPFEHNDVIDICVIIAISLFMFIPFMNTDLKNADDLCYHLLRIEGLKDGIIDVQLPVNILPNAKSGNGYLNSMYPYLFLYIPATLRLLRMSLSFSYKALILLANIGTAFATYFSVKSMTKKRYAWLLATALYMLMPYRYTNIYARGALGETLSMIFWPLIIAGLYNILIGDKKKWTYLCIGFVGIINSHILSFVMIIIFSIIACVIFIRNLFKDNRYIELIKAAVLTAVLSLWYVVPFIYYYTKESLAMDTLNLGNIWIFAINPSNLSSMIRNDDFRFYSFGIPVLFCFGYGLFRMLSDLFKNKIDRKLFLNMLTMISIVLMIMTTSYMAFNNLVQVKAIDTLLNMLQFPWRLICPASIMIIMSASILMAEDENLKKNNLGIILFAVLIALNVFTGMIDYKDNTFYAFKDGEAVYTVGHVSKVRGVNPDSNSILYPYEWRVNDAGDDKYVTTPLMTDYENATIVDYIKDGTKLRLTYTEPNTDAEVILPVMAYLGYHVYDENNNELNYRLFNKYAITTPLNGDGLEHMIIVKYEQPFIFIVATIISALGWIGIIAYAIMNKYKKNVGC